LERKPAPLLAPAPPTSDRPDGTVGSRGSCGDQSSLRLPRLSGLDLLSSPLDVHAEGLACESEVSVPVARGPCAAAACEPADADEPDAGASDDDDAGDEADVAAAAATADAAAAATAVDPVGVAGDTFSKSYVSVSLSEASNSSMTSRIVRGRRFASFANICMTRVPSSGGICRVGTRVGTRSSMARFLSKCG
jgi:hypothetical protein